MIQRDTPRNSPHSTTFGSIVLLLLVLGPSFRSATAVGDEWTRFRGPNGSGQSDSQGIPTRWTAQDYNWVTDLPGIGHSSPVVWKDRIFVQSADAEVGTQFIICLNTDDGSQVWQREFPSKSYPTHARNSLATSSPSVDENHVYVAWATPEKLTLTALDHDGKIVWQRDDLGPFPSDHGFGTSPIVVNNLVILSNQHDRSSGMPQVLALDRLTGELQWKTDRQVGKTSYSVPCVRTTKDGRLELICCSTDDGMYGLDLETGKENWSTPVFTMRTVSSPVIVGDMVFGSTGSGAGGNYVAAVHLTGGHELAYKVTRQAPYVPTVIAAQDLLFLWSDQGVVSCVDIRTGEGLWTERIGGNFSGSPVRAGSNLYCIAENGDVVVLSATREFKLLGKMPLGEASRSTPAISHGHMYLRTYSKIFSIGNGDGA